MEPKIEKKGRELSSEERKELRLGQELYETVNSSGWKNTIVKMLEDRMYHSWVDPRSTNAKEEWLWRELNAFHSADVAKQLIEDIEKIINRSEYLDKVAKGEIVEGKRMKI